MVPYFTQQLPDGRSYRVSWPVNKAQHVLNGIREKVTEFFRNRDLDRGLPEDGSCLERKEGPNGNETYSVNPAYVALKHSGREVTTEVLRRWGEFCSVERDEMDVNIPTPYEVEMAAQREAAKYVAPPNAGAMAVTTTADAPKRGRGRPRKNKRTE